MAGTLARIGRADRCAGLQLPRPRLRLAGHASTGSSAGQMRLVFSVLYEPFAEIDLDELPQSDPEDGYFADLIEHLGPRGGGARADRPTACPASGRQVRGRPRGRASTPAGWRSCTASRAASTWGARRAAITANVAELARRGVRLRDARAPVLPSGSRPTRRRCRCSPTAMYNRIFCQPRGVGLTELGEAAVRAMYEHRILVDVSHMRAEALRDTFTLLDAPRRRSGADPTRLPGDRVACRLPVREAGLHARPRHDQGDRTPRRRGRPDPRPPSAAGRARRR